MREFFFSLIRRREKKINQPYKIITLHRTHNATMAIPQRRFRNPGYHEFFLLAVFLSLFGLLVHLHDLSSCYYCDGFVSRQLDFDERFPKLNNTIVQRIHQFPSGKFAPSLNYEISRISKNETIEAAKCDSRVEWDWYNGHGKQGKNRLLIALHANFGPSMPLLDVSAKVARIYANFWNASVVVLKGTAICPSPKLNNIRLLFHAIDHNNKYDQVLILEADMLIASVEEDLSAILSSSNEDSFLLAKQKQTDATLWNLQHPKVKDVALQWFKSCQEAVKRSPKIADRICWDDTFHDVATKVLPDQSILHFNKPLSMSKREEKVNQAANDFCINSLKQTSPNGIDKIISKNDSSFKCLSLMDETARKHKSP